jgi:SWI/SNF related-matrix-associated actin-dependent regulator of chromatin subfamily C
MAVASTYHSKLKSMNDVKFGIDDLGLYSALYQAVMREPFWQAPRVYIDSNQPNHVEFEAIVKRHGGLLSSSNEANLVIVPDTKQSISGHPVRVLEKSTSSSKIFVHTFYRPDSYDTWIAENNVVNWNHTLSPPLNPNASCVVQSRYLLDLSTHGEWPVAADYDPKLTSQVLTDLPYLAFRGKKREYVDSPNGEHSSKKFKSGEDGDERIITTAPAANPKFKVDPTFPDERVMSMSDAFGVLVQPSLTSGASSSAANTLTEAGPTVPFDPISRPQGPLPSLALPNHLSWFDMGSIHDIERTALPEFFAERAARSSNKSPEIYREYRDFMIHAYQQNPAHYLNFTSCRRSLAGDSCAVMRVFDFLEHVGLINYAVNPDVHGIFPAPAPMPPPSDTVRQLLQIDNPATRIGQPVSHDQANLALRDFIAAATSKPTSLGNSVPNTKCVNCTNTASYLHFVHKSQPKVKLCPDCFARGETSNLAVSDFDRVDLRPLQIAMNDRNAWTEEETLALLDGIEQFGEDWVQIAQFVGTRDKEACILHFLRLPIEDPYFQGSTIMERSYKDLQATGATAAPFSSAPNPIMSLVSFLTQAVSPQVAAAASQAAIKAFMGERSDSQAGADTNGMELDRDSEDLTSKDITAVANAALAAATLKATLLAEKEEREMRMLVYQIVDAQLKKLELKLQYFDEMERFLDAEHTKLESARLRIFEEKFKLEEDKRKTAHLLLEAQAAADRAAASRAHPHAAPAQATRFPHQSQSGETNPYFMDAGGGY